MATGYSLHIGLNRIDADYYDGWDGALACCENDARAMLEISKKVGFSNSKLLMNEEATRENLATELLHYANLLKAGDLFFLSYSGHGGELPDLNYDEEDLLDETWCLYNGHMVDDELHKLYGKFKKGTRIFVVSDSCHSGSVVKGDLVEEGKELIDKDRLREKMLPKGVSLRSYKNSKNFYDKILKQPTTDASDIAASVLLLSGCQDNQKSFEPTNGQHGLLTGHLLQLWNDGRFEGNYENLHQHILTKMPPYQTPNLFLTGQSDPAFMKQKPFSI